MLCDKHNVEDEPIQDDDRTVDRLIPIVVAPARTAARHPATTAPGLAGRHQLKPPIEPETRP
jgi:hypothetical protein